ncbi:glycoside hydrolase family 3 N-terminal domain-containing protein [Sphingomonas sp. FARSPH]|uniref:glycoside hydrolase family 3 N-terminal domain-containing protein n=1 Tax=Sphingomonas sp. FARSPH TaxID=2219696 RepID=UPI0018E53063|nr:glycoside hydrolase family 3 N-terminal domain-containing protein [Sphingomonas sp. FARSPH]
MSLRASRARSTQRRTFEYGEDPCIRAARGAAVDGVQSQHVLSTVKHFALNAQERPHAVDGRIADDAFA